jgi:hypothetical protein
VSHFARMIWMLVSSQVRGIDRRFRAPSGRRRLWLWAIPLGGFALCVSILVVAGAMTGVWAAEYIPTALFEGLVISGLFIVCLAPVMDPPDNDPGDRGPETDPTSSPPPFDPTLWVALFRDSEPGSSGARHVKEETRREPVEAQR